MNDTDFGLVKNWLEYDDEEVNLHGIGWLKKYYEENNEAKEDRIVDLLLSQLDRELNGHWFDTFTDAEGEVQAQYPLGPHYLRLCAVKMLEENTRPYEGRIAIEIVRVAREDDSDEVALAAVETLGHFKHPLSVSFLIDECIDNEKVADSSLWSLKTIMMNGISAQLPWRHGSLRDRILRHILNVATSSRPVPFKVRRSALLILWSNQRLKDLYEKEKMDSHYNLGIAWLDETPYIISRLVEVLSSDSLIEDFGYSTAETEEIYSQMEVTLKWNNGKIKPFTDIANAMFGRYNNSTESSLPGEETEEEMQKLFEQWKRKLERDFPELNEEEQYEQFVPCFKSARKALDLLMFDVISASTQSTNAFWFEKDGSKAYEIYL